MSKNILVIDDEKLVTESLRRLLTKEGYNVVIANSCDEAMAKINEIDFNLIITDVRMPGIDGVETIKNIREHLKKGNKSPIPEIFITGYSSEENFDQAQKLKVAGYIYKPFDIKVLLGIVKKNLE